MKEQQHQRLKRLLLSGEVLTTHSITNLHPPILSPHRVLTTLRYKDPRLKITIERVETVDSWYNRYYVSRVDLDAYKIKEENN